MRSTLIAVGTFIALALSGCGGSADRQAAGGVSAAASSSSSASSSPLPSPSTPRQAGPTIDVAIAGDKITPNGARVKVPLGKPVTMRITADRAGELHVHSQPEREIEYVKGDTTARVIISRPGIVDVEDHETDVVVVQLQVS